MDEQMSFTSLYVDIAKEPTEDQILLPLAKDGIFTFNIQSREELVCFCTKLGTIVKHRDSDKNGLTRIRKRNGVLYTLSEAGYQAFTNSHLTLHTDGSSASDPATLIVLWCAHPAEEGGISLFADGKQIYHVLAHHYPHVLQKFTMPDSAIFSGAQPPFYSSIFSTLPNGNIYIRFRYDSLVYYSAPVCSELPIFLQLLNQHSVSFTLKKHQGYVIQNGRWLHGRTAFDGDRDLYRVLVQTEPNTLVGKQVMLGFSPDLEQMSCVTSC